MKKNKPKYLLYIAISCFASFVIIALGCKNSDDIDGFVYSSLISICGGILASLLVMLLIDKSESRTRDYNTNNILLELRISFGYFMMSITKEVVFANESYNDKSMTFTWWVRKYIIMCRLMNINKEGGISAALQVLVSEVKKIEHNSAFYIVAGTITGDEYHALYAMRATLESLIKMTMNGYEKSEADSIVYNLYSNVPYLRRIFPNIKTKYKYGDLSILLQNLKI